MADEDETHAAIRDQALENVEDLRLHGDIERRGRLVRDQHIRLADQHHRDHHALAHAARNLVRVEIIDATGLADLHSLQHGDRPLAGLCGADPRVDTIGFRDLLADGHNRVQRELWILHHHRDVLAAQGPPLGPAHLAHVLAAIGQSIRQHLARPGYEIEDRAAGHRLAGTGFADDCKFLAAEREGQPAYGLDDPRRRMEADAEVLDLDQRAFGCRVHAHQWASSTSRSPSPSRLKPSATRQIAMPGKAATHH